MPIRIDTSVTMKSDTDSDSMNMPKVWSAPAKAVVGTHRIHRSVISMKCEASTTSRPRSISVLHSWFMETDVYCIADA